MKSKTNNIKLFLFLLFFSLISVNCFAATTQIFLEEFNYNDLYTNHGWSYTRNCIYHPNTPIESYFETFAYGFNGTSGCGTGTLFYINKPLIYNATNGIFTLSYDYEIKEDSTSFSSPLLIQLKNSSGVNAFILTHNDNATGQMKFRTQCQALGTNCKTCNYDLTVLNTTLPFTMSGVISINLDTNKYTWSIDGLESNCSDIDFADNYKITSVTLLSNVDTSERLNFTLDNLYMLLSTDIGLYEFGSYCDTDADCVSDYCFRHICGLKPNLEDCNTDSECLSGICSNGHCTKPSIFASLEASKNEQFGDDDDSNNFISLLLMTLTALSFIFGGARFGSMKAGLIGGVSAFFLLGLFFAIVGWLSAFIILGMLLILLILVIFGFMIGGSSD